MSASVWDARKEALRLAVGAVGPWEAGTQLGRHQAQVLDTAAEFAEFLLHGTVPADRDTSNGKAPASADEPPRLLPEPWTGLQKMINRMHLTSTHGPAAIKAAIAWVDHAHLNNPAGLDNWRNWADDHDIDLINAVLALKELPPLERKQP